MTASPASRLVRVRTPQGVAVDVAVEAETATAAHVVGEAVETALGLRGGANAVEVERTGLILGGETWGDSRVREGDLLLLRRQLHQLFLD